MIHVPDYVYEDLAGEILAGHCGYWENGPFSAIIEISSGGSWGVCFYAWDEDLCEVDCDFDKDKIIC